jgi:nucleoid-associated protein YgaU
VTNPLTRRPAPLRPATSELARAKLVDTTTGTAHPVMYNPEELKLEQGAVYAEVGVPGLDTPPVQYVRGKPRTLSMELFFDTYETGEDVRRHTGPIVKLLERQPQTQAPPILLFLLGGFQLRCVLVEAGQRFTMFLRNGTPVRSTLSVRLQEYSRLDVEITSGVFFGSPTVSGLVNTAVGAVVAVAGGTGVAEALHTVVSGDTLSGLAGAYLGDPARWREIAEANGIDDPLSLPPGAALLIPGAPR